MAAKRWVRSPFFWLVWTLILSGCASVLSQEAIEASQPRIPFQLILEHPDQVEGRTVILGGALLKVHDEGGVSVLEVLEQPLSRRLRPIHRDQSGGRFLVQMKSNVDTKVFESNRLLTLAGRVIDSQSKPVGQTQYRYPVLVPVELYLWPRPGEESYYSPRVFIHLGGSVSF